MRLFSGLYDLALRWARHRHAERYLAGLSFAESSFFPIPPEGILVPMALAEPRKGLRFALVTTVASVLGGAAGYAIGWFAADTLEPMLHRVGYWEGYLRAVEWFDEWGFLAVLGAGFSPVPYKLFTIAAGALQMPFLPFVLASLVGRGARFFLVAGLIRWGGRPMERKLRQHVDVAGWISIALLVVLYFVLR